MTKAQQDEIPKSIIKGDGVIHADLDSSKGTGKLLFISPKCTVVGLNNLPYMLFATPEFSEDILPPNIRKRIHEIKELVLQPSFSTQANKSILYCKIPKWLVNFKKIESLRFEHVDLGDLNCLYDLPIQHLTFENVKYNDTDLLNTIKKFKHLNQIFFDKSLSADLRHSFEKLKLKLTPISN